MITLIIVDFLILISIIASNVAFVALEKSLKKGFGTLEMLKTLKTLRTIQFYLVVCFTFVTLTIIYDCFQ